MDATVERKILNLLGLGVRGRLVVTGVEQVRDAVKRGKVRVAVIAADASPNSREKVEKLLVARGVTTLEVPSAGRLGAVAGKGPTAAMGVVDAKLSAGILAAAEGASATQSPTEAG